MPPLLIAVLLATSIGSADLSRLTVPITHAAEWDQESVKTYAAQVAEEYGLNVERFLATLACENHFKAKGQSQHPQLQKIPLWYVMQGDPLKEQSFGSAMINLPSHPTVTKEMAEDPYFAIPWMADKWVKGYARWWSCYQDLFM